jgi:hypothetical protein
MISLSSTKQSFAAGSTTHTVDHVATIANTTPLNECATVSKQGGTGVVGERGMALSDVARSGAAASGERRAYMRQDRVSDNHLFIILFRCSIVDVVHSTDNIIILFDCCCCCFLLLPLLLLLLVLVFELHKPRSFAVTYPFGCHSALCDVTQGRRFVHRARRQHHATARQLDLQR